ncbi:hypothetical protein LZ32DRAFT_159393 [Colletotrichum eremochloae]|nr:hypothetical protein LZ32DRAFT_159393 [Colletotrichum eremochloae]
MTVKPTPIYGRCFFSFALVPCCQTTLSLHNTHRRNEKLVTEINSIGRRLQRVAPNVGARAGSWVDSEDADLAAIGVQFWQGP